MIDELVEKVLPGNYWLTKSMEFNRITTSGSLWYIKKWLVFYKYLFLNEHIYDNDYNTISDIFDNFIESLDDDIKDDAKSFFYSVDIKSINFIKFNDFINTATNFENSEQKINYIRNAKRFYFMYLMNSGGQAGWKLKIKNKILEGKKFEDLINEIRKEMSDEGLNEKKIIEQLSDFPASIRNERQIYFYYGIFHGRDGANLTGFYNLTAIGKAIIISNFYELSVIWEHQKLKMISQSPVSEIQKLNNVVAAENFSINSDPYFDLLRTIQKYNKLKVNSYQYILSKTNNNLKLNDLFDYDINDSDVINLFKEKAESFDRRSDIAKADFTKEIKKYILGISNLNLDKEKNPFSFLSYIKNGEISIENKTKLDFTINLYSQISKYKNDCFSEKFIEYENELKQKYTSIINNSEFFSSKSITYEWSKYIINFDENMLFTLFYWSISMQEGMFDFNIHKSIFALKYNNFKNILKIMNFKKNDFINTMLKIQHFLSENNYFKFDLDFNLDYQIIDPKKISDEIDMDKLEIYSNASLKNNIYSITKRTRNGQLINGIRSYYFKNFTKEDSKLISCDCCTKSTFLTYNNFPYLEFHHLIPFSTEFGPDHYLNLFGLCPDCHRKIHFSMPTMRKELYDNLTINNNFKTNLLVRINTLYEKGFIEPIHLDFLLKEQIIDENQYELLMSKPIVAA